MCIIYKREGKEEGWRRRKREEIMGERERGNDAKQSGFFFNEKSIIYKQQKHHLILQRI